MRLAILNCNTSRSMTDRIAATARATASPGTEIVALEPLWGPSSVESYYDGFIAAAAMLDRVATLVSHDLDALVLAGFGEVGREALREQLHVPVVDIAEAAALVAQLLAPRYGVVTCLPRQVGLIRDNLRLAGLLERCASIRALGVDVLDSGADEDATVARFLEEAAHAVADGAEALCLGSAGFTGMATRLSEALGMPVVDGVAAAVTLAESCHRMGLRTSKLTTWSDPIPKERKGWPVSAPEHSGGA